MYSKRIPKHLIFDPQPKRRKKVWFVWLSGIVITCLILIISVDALAASMVTSHAGQLSMQTREGLPLPTVHLQTEIDASINGMVVNVNYTQRFKNTSDQWVQGTYVFPLPHNAAIQHMEINVGGQRITGEIRVKKDAERAYAKAKTAGKRAALTTQQRDNLFTQQVANIPPHQTIDITLTFIDAVTFNNGLFEWRLPTTVTPRYMPGISQLPPELTSQLNTHLFGWTIPTDWTADAASITPPMIASSSNGIRNPLSLSLSLNSGVPVSSIQSLYHELDIKKTSNHYAISLRESAVEMDRDLVLQWRPNTSTLPQAAVFQQQLNGEYYAMAMMIPPTASKQTSLTKDIIFVIDVSGSMQGDAIKQATSSLSIAIDQLSSDDTFNILAFSDRIQTFNTTPVLATSDIKDVAKQWISALQADGGTDMYPALLEAFKQLRPSEQLQQIVFITDGAIGNEEMLFELIARHNNHASLFTVGIGSAPNTFFMAKAAELGRGSYEMIGRTDEVRDSMDKLFTKLNQVAATNIKLNWPADAEVYPSQSADLFYSEARLSFAKLTQPLSGLQISGMTANQPWLTRVQTGQSSDFSGVGTLWARHKVADLDDRVRRGNIEPAEAKQAITHVGLTHQLLTRYTAFLAIEDTPVNTTLEPVQSVRIANVMPRGIATTPLTFANTATTATLTFWLGLLACIALFLLRLNRCRVCK